MQIKLLYLDGREEYISRELNCYIEFPPTISHNIYYFDNEDLKEDPNQPYLPIRIIKQFQFYGFNDILDTPIYREMK